MNGARFQLWNFSLSFTHANMILTIHWTPLNIKKQVYLKPLYVKMYKDKASNFKIFQNSLWEERIFQNISKYFKILFEKTEHKGSEQAGNTW